MFFEFSKILDFLLSPLIWGLILMLAALVLRNKVKARRLFISSFVILLFFSNSFIVDEFVRLTEAPLPVKQCICKPYDAGIVLGGGLVMEDEETGTLIFQQNTDRMLQAVKLYKQGKIKKILLSSGSGSVVFKDALESSMLRSYLIDIGIPAGDILVDSVSRNTYENAVCSAKILTDSLPGGDYLLITSALHMKRAQACFLRQRILTVAYPVSKKTGYRRWDIGYLLVPNVENFRTWEKLLHEWVGYLVYEIKGYV
jgi:uncharacterized SAM-binding protein YcdF (DUF218 family)